MFFLASAVPGYVIARGSSSKFKWIDGLGFSALCPASRLFSDSLSLSLFYCFLEEPQDSVELVSLDLRDVEEKEGQGSVEMSEEEWGWVRCRGGI